MRVRARKRSAAITLVLAGSAGLGVSGGGSAGVSAVHPWDMMLWALIAGIVQLLVYVAVRYSLLNVSRRIPDGQIATGFVLGAVSLSAGILNAACMTY